MSGYDTGAVNSSAKYAYWNVIAEGVGIRRSWVEKNEKDNLAGGTSIKNKRVLP